MLSLIHYLYNKYKLTFPYHTIGYYDLPETYLRSEGWNY